MTDSDLQLRVMAALSPTPVQLAVDVIAYRASDKASVTTYTRFLGERAASAVVQNPNDERLVLDFLSEIELDDIAAATESRPIAVCSSRAARNAGLDVCIVLHPSVATVPASLAAVAFMRPRTYLTFPAFEHEFTASDTPDEARRRLATAPNEVRGWYRSFSSTGLG